MSPGRPHTGRARSSARQTADEAVVRRYLRNVIGAPVRGGDDRESETRFIAVARRWAERSGVDRRTLASIGVDGTILDRAGVATVPAGQRLRRHWHPAPFSVADLARRAGMPIATVRRAVAIDEDAGLLHRAGRDGRAILYEDR